MLQVQRERALVSLRPTRNPVTFRQLGEELFVPIVAEYSDATRELDLTLVAGLSVTSTAPAIVSVTAQGRLRAVSAGSASIVAAVGGVQTALAVAVDPRTPSTVTGISIPAATGPLSLDEAPLFARAVVSATGALDDFTVTSTITRGTAAPTTSTDVTDLSGAVGFRLDNAAFAGSVTVTASVVDTTSGQTFSDTKSFVLSASTGDHEPNNNPALASPLRVERTALGAIGSTGDGGDTFRLDADLAGTLEIVVRALGGAGSYTVVVRTAAGQELARIGPTAGNGILSVDIPTGAVFVSVESVSGSVNYSLTSHLSQADVVVGSVTPSAGAPGTLVTIAGTGFSTILAQNQAFFAGVAAEVVAASSTSLTVRVPANAVNGSLEVTSGDRTIRAAGFSTGNAALRPPAYVRRGDPALMREDPTSGAVIDITRLLVDAAPAASLADMGALASGLGATIAGFIPMTNQYVLEFPQNRTFDGLNSLRQQAESSSKVRRVWPVESVRFDSPPNTIDIDHSGVWPNDAQHRAAMDLIKLFDAIELVRSTPPFDDRDNLKDVRVAVVDTGFAPGRPEEFVWSDQRIAQLLVPESRIGRRIPFDPELHRYGPPPRHARRKRHRRG